MLQAFVERAVLDILVSTKKAKKEAMKISNYLDIDLVVFLNAESRDDALQTLVEELSKSRKLPEKKTFFKAILEREKIVSTGIGMGVALPHAKLKDLKEFFIVIGIQKNQGLDWKAIDKAPVRIIFMIGGPDDRSSEYLQILSSLTKGIKDEEVRKKLLKASTSEEVIKLFESF